MLIEQKIQELLEKRNEARLGGGQKRIDSQHAFDTRAIKS